MSVKSKISEHVILESKTTDGIPLKVVYDPDQGMNLISFQWGDRELINQSTEHDLENHRSCGGALLGPHFKERNPLVVPDVDPALFPHLKNLKEKKEPFPDGISRYVSWKTESTSSTIQAKLTGKDEWKGVPLSVLEGQDFTMDYQATLSEKGLDICFSVLSASESVIGLDYQYAFSGKGEIRSDVKQRYFDKMGAKELPKNWQGQRRHELHFALPQEADFGFQPFRNPIKGNIALDLGGPTLKIDYKTSSEENSWSLYQPKEADFVSICPLTAENPFKPQLSVSSIEVLLSVE